MKRRPFSIPLLLLAVAASVLVACATRQPPQESWERGEVERTLEQGLRWLEEHPNDHEARRLTGAAALRMGDTLAAYRIWREDVRWFLQHRPAVGRHVLQMALERGDAAWVDSMVATLESMPQGAVDSAWTAQLQALARMQVIQARRDADLGDRALLQGQLVRARELYQRALENQRRDQFRARELAVRAWMLAAGRDVPRPEEIFVLLDRARRLWPEGAPVLYAEGRVSALLDRPDRVRRAFEELRGGRDAGWAARLQPFVQGQ